MTEEEEEKKERELKEIKEESENLCKTAQSVSR